MSRKAHNRNSQQRISRHPISRRPIARRPLIAAAASVAVAGPRMLSAAISPAIKVSLSDAHKGTLKIDTQLLDSYEKPPEHLRQFYFDARAHFAANKDADFSDPEIIEAAQKHGLALMGGPLLGDLTSNGVSIWLRPVTNTEVVVKVDQHRFSVTPDGGGQALRIPITGLRSNTHYTFNVLIADQQIAGGSFTTAPTESDHASFRIAFGSCCHKIGVHNPNLFGEIIKRKPHAMMLLGDIAVDDRNNEINMHRADYQLRDVSVAWRRLVSNVPVYASWDDHDYFDNDLNGIPKRYTAQDRDAVRRVYAENWNNPSASDSPEGIYFRSRVGPVEIIMLDTRSCRDNARRNQYGSYLGKQQMNWLKSTLKSSTAPFKVISSGTMWSDYVSKAKDSWGSWDREAREEIFSLIESESIGGVLLVSGDRHGARGFRIPRPSGFHFYEFEPATLGGVSGPAGIVKDCPEQLFGYDGRDFIACGEFTFDTSSDQPGVTFRLISETGDVLEKHALTLEQLSPPTP